MARRGKAQTCEWLAVALVAFGVHSSVGASAPAVVALDPKGMTAVAFDRIPATAYRLEEGALVATVASSSSFLLLPFDAPRAVRAVTFEWRSDGAPNVPNASAEASKEGDDAVWRVGLVVAGDAPFLPMLAPTWMKLVRSSLKAPAGSLLYLTVGAKHKAGARWTSPHADSIESLSVASEAAAPEADGPSGWMRARVELPKTLDVVGLWLMADGDDTKARFTARLRNLALD